MTAFSVVTLGCKVNQYETERLVADLSRTGLVFRRAAVACHVVVVNSCAVTAGAEAKSRKELNKVVKANPGALIVRTGCLTNDEATGDGLPRSVVAEPDKARVARLVAASVGGGFGRRSAKASPVLRTRRLLKVQDGCDRGCSYCVVPAIRGRPNSRPKADIVAEARRLGQNGAKEVVVTGINVGRYGSDFGEESSLLDLLEALADVREVRRFRLSSINVEDLSPRLIRFLGTEDRFCPHVHIPVQSGSDRILALMNRSYCRSDVLTVIDELRSIRAFSVTTDVIIGFPGEEETDFEATLSLMRDADCLKAHVFKYSARPGTAASGLPGHVRPTTMRARARRAGRLSEELTGSHLGDQIGRVLEVVVEESERGQLTGVSREYMRVFFGGPPDLVGRLAAVRINCVRGARLLGELVDHQQPLDQRSEDKAEVADGRLHIL